MRSLLIALFVISLLPVAPASAATETAEALVKQTTERMLSALHANHDVIAKHPDRIYGLVDKIVLPHFDFEGMARGVLGIYWRRASAAQRQRFVKEFRTLLVRTYASSLAQYDDQKVEYLPVRPSGDPDAVTIRTQIEQKSGFPIPVDYDLERQHGEWKVIGITIDNLNLVTNYRSSFGVEIRQQGIDGLIKKLAERNKQAGQ
jgi:phospholipid transport system substrate-binding protein